MRTRNGSTSNRHLCIRERHLDHQQLASNKYHSLHVQQGSPYRNFVQLVIAILTHSLFLALLQTQVLFFFVAEHKKSVNQPMKNYPPFFNWTTLVIRYLTALYIPYSELKPEGNEPLFAKEYGIICFSKHLCRSSLLPTCVTDIAKGPQNILIL